MKNYTNRQMDSIRSLAFIQMKEGIYLIDVPMGEGNDLLLLTPWMDETGKQTFRTDREAISYWGEETFSSFCDKAIAYLEDDTVQNRFN